MSFPQNKRRGKRDMCSDLVEVSFQDQEGRWVRETGLMEDVSAAGLCVSFSLPVSVGRSVELNAEGFRGKARVCYCTLGDYSYLLGLEFSDGFQWDRQKWQPKHLLTLPDESA